jgi:hypothetical protein
MDILRVDDMNQMRLMQKELTKMRKAKQKNKSVKRGGGVAERPTSSVTGS